jgi:hypothetical protein
MSPWIVILIVGTSLCSAVSNVSGLLMLRRGQAKIEHIERGLVLLYQKLTGKK